MRALRWAFGSLRLVGGVVLALVERLARDLLEAPEQRGQGQLVRLGGAAGAASGSLLLLLLLLLLFLLLLFLLLREEVSDLVGESLSLRRVDKARVPHASRVGGEEVAVVEVVVALAHDRRVGERPVVLAELKPSRREALGGDAAKEHELAAAVSIHGHWELRRSPITCIPVVHRGRRGRHRGRRRGLLRPAHPVLQSCIPGKR